MWDLFYCFICVFLILSLVLSNVLLTDCWTSIRSGCSGVKSLAILHYTFLSCSFKQSILLYGLHFLNYFLLFHIEETASFGSHALKGFMKKMLLRIMWPFFMYFKIILLWASLNLALPVYISLPDPKVLFVLYILSL